ncbi:MAG: PucC family protein, partial [Polyangiales bacterium]
VLAMFRLEGHGGDRTVAARPDRPAFRQALRQVWGEADARRFTIFVFVSMLAYSAQDLILEPFAGVAYGWTPGETTKLSGTQHGGVFLGMVAVAVITTVFKGTPIANLKGWVVGGCLASGVAMLGLVAASASGGTWPLEANVFVLGVANGVFSIAAIAGMMTLASQGRGEREGTRMGLWGAAQAIAFGAGGFLGTVLVDFASAVSVPAALSYGFVFALEALGFFIAQHLAAKTAFTKSTEERRDARLSYGTQAVGQGQVS